MFSVDQDDWDITDAEKDETWAYSGAPEFADYNSSSTQTSTDTKHSTSSHPDESATRTTSTQAHRSTPPSSNNGTQMPPRRQYHTSSRHRPGSTWAAFAGTQRRHVHYDPTTMELHSKSSSTGPVKPKKVRQRQKVG